MAGKTNKPVVFSALEVANICGVVNQTAINWIRSGYLTAFKTPGGQFRVYPDDLMEFMKKREMRIPDDLTALCSSLKRGTKNLLIVDDDKGLNTVIAMYMERKFENLKIYQAFDGFDAGSRLTEHKIDCLILDLDLPGIDGFDLCRRINTNARFNNPTIIVVTALEENDVEKRVAEFGVRLFLKKPLNLLELSQSIESILSSSD